jgi:ribosomal protein S1
MEEVEAPIEKIQEKIEELAREGHEHEAEDQWVNRVALSSAIIAVFAAIAALQSGHHSSEALIEQIQSSNQWAYYQAKGIKGHLLATKIDLFAANGHAVSEDDKAKLDSYRDDQEKISEIAKEKQEAAEHHLKIHQAMAKSVTFFQIAIAISAISILVRRRKFWYGSLAFASIGLGFFVWGFFI